MNAENKKRHPLPRAKAGEDAEVVELTTDVSSSPFYNHDMAPVGRAGRRWRTKDLAVLWIGMSACIPTYMLASGLIQQGMNWWQAVLTIFLGNVIVLLPMIANAHAGTKYGIPFPVYCRASFGILGAIVPAILRAFVACGWFGIQTWIGGEAIYKIMAVFVPQWQQLEPLWPSGINAAQLGCFLFFWSINMLVIYLGIESIRVLLNIKALLLIVLGLALLTWAYQAAGGFGEMLSRPSQFAAGQPQAGKFWLFFFPALTANVGFWATLSLNIPDFSRYAYSQRDQMLGQALGLPTTMGLFSFIGVAVTSAAYVIYANLPPEQESHLWDPVFLLTLFDNPVVLVVAMGSLCLATLATNIAANVVSPANDFANLWPRVITFRIGGFITGIIGIAIQPWHLVANADVYIGKWLIGCSSLLGAIGGILIADYFLIRRTKFDLPGLYERSGPYWYRGGFNIMAIAALICGIALCVPGFLHSLNNTKFAVFSGIWAEIYRYAWFVSFGVSLAVYVAVMKLSRPGEAKNV